MLQIGAVLARLNAALAHQAAAAVAHDGADAIVLGCTGFFVCAEFIVAELAAPGAFCTGDRSDPSDSAHRGGSGSRRADPKIGYGARTDDGIWRNRV